MELKNKFNSEIWGYVNEIASKLKNERASVMVGAGFSKNAEQITQTDKTFLDWNSLGNLFFEKTNGHSPTPNDQYLNVLKLAQEVEAAYGRATLNDVIREHLPDAEYAPSKLHEKLLKLAWKDVFTTNYDTLLERTLDRITERHYSLILNKEDLIYSSHPRIIKLHGSFPSTLPFIITEEDYRQYPKTSAIFVNTVQQTLIENALCLVGFSGDDPNFLQWIGWIRDNIGKDIASKIYLVGIFNFSSAQLNVLNSRNIVVLDMSKCPGIKDHYSGLELFFDALEQLTKDKDTTTWPDEQPCAHIDTLTDCDNNKIEMIIDVWSKSRTTYPGWIIAPSETRKSLLWKTDCCYMDVFYHIRKGHVDAKTAFNFLYEYNWRINKCLRPIFKNEINIYETVLCSINPFPESISVSDSKLNYEDTKPDWKDISKKWIDLYIDLLRAYRENGLFTQFNGALKNLEKLNLYIGPEQAAKIHCEKVRQHFFAMNITAAAEELKRWPIDVSLPAFELQRAGLLMELGDISQALKILQAELSYIRKDPVKGINWFKISTEAYLVRLVSYANQALRDKSAIEEEPGEKELNKKYDAYAEIKLFEALLKERADKPIEKEEYDLNRSTRTIMSSDNSYVEAFQFIRFFEEIGSPFNANHVVSGNKACLEAINRINPYAPLWSLILQIKVNDNKFNNKLWSRDNISKMSNQEIEATSTLCINAIKDNIEYIKEGNSFTQANFQLGIAAVVPELLSRLCARMTDELKLETLNLLDLIYRSEVPSNFKNLKNFARRLISSMSETLKIENLNLLMKTYLCQPQNIADKLDFSDIFESFNYSKEKEELYKTVKLDDQVPEILLQLLDKQEAREIALTRLVYLYNFGLLKEQEVSVFQKNIWGNIGENGLPKIPHIYSKKYILDLPAPENIDVHSLIKKYILNLEFPIEQKGVTCFSAYNRPLFLLELETCSSSFDYPNGIKWSSDEINIIIDKILKAWKHDISLLSEKDREDLEKSDIFNVIYDKYVAVDGVLSQVVLSGRNETQETTRGKLKELLLAFEEYNLPCIQLGLLVKNELNAFDRMYDIICGSDIKKINAACNAVYTAVSMKRREHKKALLTLLKKLSLIVRIRRKQGLSSVIYLFHNLFYSDLISKNNEIIENLVFGLEQLLKETKLSDNSLECTTNQCLRLRAAANSLAYILYKKFNNDSVLITRILPWKELSGDLNEFSEIRNKWIDN